MSFENKIYKKGDYIYKDVEKRVATRADFFMDIYYPMINSESVYEVYQVEGPLMRTINISKDGVLIESKISLSVGDFLNFTLKVEENPSFWCLVEVKRLLVKESLYYLGCEFISLNMNQINMIDEYIQKS